MQYLSYLKTKHWIDTRKQHYSHDENKCCYVCGSKKNLNVHHLRYKKRGKSILNKEMKTPWYLITFCEPCHKLWHTVAGEYGLSTSSKKKWINKWKQLIPKHGPEAALRKVCDHKRKVLDKYDHIDSLKKEYGVFWAQVYQKEKETKSSD